MHVMMRTLVGLAMALPAAGASVAVAATAAQAADAATVVVTLAGTTASSSDPEAASVAGQVVTITAPGSYRFTGTLVDGQIVVHSAAGGAVALLLDGASVSSSTGPAVLVRAADSVRVTLAAGTENSLADGSAARPTDGPDESDATLFSVADLTIDGAGALTVRGNAADAITSKRRLAVESGTITATATDDGLLGTLGLTVAGGTLTVRAGTGAGLKASSTTDLIAGNIDIAGGTLAVTASADACVKAANTITVTGGAQTLSCLRNGLDAGKAVTVSAGTVTIPDCEEGIEGAIITVSGGSLDITARDDGINGEIRGADDEVYTKDVLVTISGGRLVIDAAYDGLDSNGDMLISGGVTVVNGPVRGKSGAVSVTGRFAVTGGTLLAAGPARLAQVPANPDAQGFLDVRFSASKPAGTVLHVVDADGTELVAYRSVKAFSALLFTAPVLVPGKAYRIYAGGEVAGTGVGGMFPGGSLTGATLVATVQAGGAGPATA